MISCLHNHLSLMVKNFENWLIFGNVMGKSRVSLFFLTHGVLGL